MVDYRNSNLVPYRKADFCSNRLDHYILHYKSFTPCWKQEHNKMFSMILFKMTTASASFLLFNTLFFKTTITSFLFFNQGLKGKPSRRKKKLSWELGLWGWVGGRAWRVRGMLGSSSPCLPHFWFSRLDHFFFNDSSRNVKIY